MRIREVELVGFKSFVEKTRVIFDNRITGVVGPNGCGKSNIVDAIKWVMGELSAKSLRGDSMEDVIFNGTDTRKPLSMAQVSLIFSTEDGIVPPGYEMFEDIEITRRLYRSGESEYLINKQPGRLKDISEMLMDTGLGAKAYSIVEQGQISQVISAKPEQRRILIEEAAGITKFRVRKEEALRKVERTLSDLDRVQDVVAEIKRQMLSLARQATKARKYKEIREELRQVDLEVAAREYRHLARRFDELEADLARLTQMSQTHSHQIETGEAHLSESQLTLAQLQSRVEDARKVLSTTNEAIRSAENERNVLSRDIENDSERARTFQEEIIRAEERIANLEKSSIYDDAQSAELTERADRKQQELDKLVAQLNQERKLLSIKNTDTDQVRAQQVDLVEKVTHVRSVVAGWKDRRDELLSRSDSLSSKAAQTAERVLGLNDRIEGLRVRHVDLMEDRKKTAENHVEKLARLGTLKEQMNEQSQRYEHARESHQQIAVRLASLSAMKTNMEGYREGVRRILLATAKENEAGGTIQGVIGVVADLVDVPQQLEAAFEAVLGERLQAVVVEDLKAGLEAADFLKSEKSGRSSFVPMSPRRKDFTTYPDQTVNQSEGPLIDQLRFDDKYAPVLRHLLDGVLVVDNLDKAAALHKANGYRGAFVTREGEILDPHGMITGGHREALNSGILQMKREIEELTEGAQNLENDHHKARDIYLQSEGLIATQETVTRNLSVRLDEIGLEIREVEAEILRSENELGALRETQEEIAAQVESIAHVVQRGDKEFETQAGQRDQLQGDLELVRKVLAQSESGTRELSARIESLGNQVTECSSQVSADREKAAAALQRAQAARLSLGENQEQIDRLRAQILQSERHATQCKTDINAIVSKIEQLIQQSEQQAAQEIQVREELQNFVETVRQKEQSLKVLRKDLDAVTQQIGALNTTLVEVKLTRENLCAQIEMQYSESLSGLVKEYGDSEIDDEALKTRQESLRGQLRAMGDVNLSAIEEHDEAKKRYDFYIEQQEDLLKAIDHLRQAITKISKESRERFAKTFAAVATKFSEVIPMLFGGGSAKLSLTESNDILDAGVEVHVRPPGKKLQNMNLLSGGEKALAAIGLIFSVFLIKPSPFCLLDEVDAPLDDANIYRFNELIEDMAACSQVILITHNKRTMEKADALFGVTMQEKGVSKMVSVQLSDETKQASA